MPERAKRGPRQKRGQKAGERGQVLQNSIDLLYIILRHGNTSTHNLVLLRALSAR